MHFSIVVFPEKSLSTERTNAPNCVHSWLMRVINAQVTFHLQNLNQLVVCCNQNVTAALALPEIEAELGLEGSGGKEGRGGEDGKILPLM